MCWQPSPPYSSRPPRTASSEGTSCRNNQPRAIAIGGTVVANMAVKIGVILAYARGKGTSAAIALGASTLVLAGTLMVAWYGRV